MLLAWNASSSISKQKDCKNKKTWLTQTALCKYFSLFHITYIEDIRIIFSLKTCFILKDLATKSLLNFQKIRNERLRMTQK